MFSEMHLYGYVSVIGASLWLKVVDHLRRLIAAAAGGKTIGEVLEAMERWASFVSPNYGLKVRTLRISAEFSSLVARIVEFRRPG